MANIQKSNPSGDTAVRAIAEEAGVSVEAIKSLMADKGIADPSLLIGTDELEALKGAIAPSTPSKTAKRGKRQTRRTNQQTDFGSAIAHTAQQSAAEIEAFQFVLREGKDRWVEHTANDIVDELRSAPNEVVQQVAAIAMEEQADAEFFRSEAQRLSSALFAIG